MNDSVGFETLVGEHLLEGVDFGVGEKGEYDYSAPNTCVFLLDGKTYTCTEDPSDGYRSMMESLKVSDAPVTNRFPACRVVGSLRTNYKHGGTSDVLEFRDCKTGKVVLTIGTENTDDYYPWYVAEFDPTAMAINS